MIYGYLHQGSGVGNQLHRMVATRIKAIKLGTDWKMIWNPDNSGKVDKFKAKEFMEFDEGKIQYGIPFNVTEWNEKKVVENGVDIRGYDPEFNFVQDNTIIEGEFQDEKYWDGYDSQINEWLRVPPLHVPKDMCVIGFRGGEFSVFPDLFLTKDYWDEATKMMKEINPYMKFEVHTDDPETAKQFFPDYEVIRDVSRNWRSIRFAKYAIIANSSFYIFPRWLNRLRGGLTIAPRYWARRNTGVWALPQNYYKRFTYI